MKVIRAEHLGMCFGVRDAITLALKEAEAGPLTILGDLVHNSTVLATLREKGIAIEQQASKVTTATVMVTAHGASERSLAETRSLGLSVVEATCPLVRAAHRAIAALVRDGYHPVIIGKRDHAEVLGLTGDLDAFDVVLHEDDVRRLAERPRYGIAVQTTQPLERCDPWSRSFGSAFQSRTSASWIPCVSRRNSVSRPPSSWRSNATS